MVYLSSMPCILYVLTGLYLIFGDIPLDRQILCIVKPLNSSFGRKTHVVITSDISNLRLDDPFIVKF